MNKFKTLTPLLPEVIGGQIPRGISQILSEAPNTLKHVGVAGRCGYPDQFVEYGQAQFCRGSPNKDLRMRTIRITKSSKAHGL